MISGSDARVALIHPGSTAEKRSTSMSEPSPMWSPLQPLLRRLVRPIPRSEPRAACISCRVASGLLEGVVCDGRGGPHGPTLYGEAAAAELRRKWAPVFEGRATSKQQEDRFLAHVSASQVIYFVFPVDLIGRLLLRRRDWALGPARLGYTACAAAGPRYEQAWESYLR